MNHKTKRDIPKNFCCQQWCRDESMQTQNLKLTILSGIVSTFMSRIIILHQH